MAAITTYANLRAHFETVLSSFAVSGATLHWPDTDQDPPTPSSNPASPTATVLLEYVIDGASILTMDKGSSELRGRLVALIWVDQHSGDGMVLSIAEALRTLVIAGDTQDDDSSIAFLEPRLGPAVTAGNESVYGRELHCPFVWLRGA